MEPLGTRLLETERIVLRKICLNDYKEMYDNWASIDECSKFLPWSAVTDIDAYKERVSAWVDNYKDDFYFNWIIERKETKEIIGIINLHNVDLEEESAETSYILTPRYWGKGIMTEVLTRVLQYAFEDIKLKRVCADIFQGNLASGKVLQKCGMQKVGIVREKYYKNEEKIDSIEYAILCGEWRVTQYD